MTRNRRKLIALLASLIAANGSQSAEDAKSMAEISFLEGRYIESATLFQSAAQSTSDKQILLYDAGYAALCAGDTASGESLLVKAADADSNDGWTCYRLAQLRAALGDTTAALMLILRATDDESGVGEFYTFGAQMYLASQDTVNAVAWAEEGMDKSDGTPECLILLADVLNSSGKMDKAEELLEKAIGGFPYPDLLFMGYRFAVAAGDSGLADKCRNTYIQLYSITEEAMQTFGIPAAGSHDEPFDSSAAALTCRWLEAPSTCIYKATWGPITLGRLSVETREAQRSETSASIPVSYQVVSNPDIPFIRIDDDYRSWLSPTLAQTQRYEMKVNETWWQYRRTCIMDYQDGLLIQHSIEDDGRIAVHQKQIPSQILDGTSLLLYARAQVRARHSGRAITLIDYSYVWTEVNCDTNVVQINVAGHDWGAIHVSGTAGYTGVAGLSGNFEGWFSADSSALPLRAKFKIFIGSIILELEQRNAGSGDSRQ